MTRFGIAILIAFALVASAARAGDGAALHVLGFSADGRHFVFEQYGEQDGAGSIYSWITAVDGDRPIAGMPIINVMDPDEPREGQDSREKLLADVRAQANGDASAILAQFGISLQPAAMVASVKESQARNMIYGELVKSVRTAAVDTLALPADRLGHDARLVLRSFDIALPRCQNAVNGEHPNGFGLTLERKGRPTIHLHRDQTIPAVRGCPDHYGIAEAHALPLPDGAVALAVIIQYFYQAFHGPDRRFLVVTGRIP
jgi:predicted secreted protein